MPVDKESLSSRLRQRVNILAPPAPESRNELGEPIEQFAVVAANVPAEVKTLSGREPVNAAQVAAEATHVVTIRWRPGITRANVLDHGLARLNVDAAIDEDNRKVELKLYCREERQP